MKTNASLIYSLFLVVGDFLALVGAFAGAYVLRVSISHQPFPNQIHAVTYLEVFLAILPFWILVFALLGLYNTNIYERRFPEMGRLLIGSFIGLLFVIFWDFLSVTSIFPAKLVPFYGFGLSFIFLVLFRNLIRAVRIQLFEHGISVTNILIVGNTAIADELVTTLADSRVSGYRVLGVVGDKRRAYRADFTTFDEALEATQGASLHGVIQTELYADEARNREVLEYAQTHHLGYRFVPGNTELFVGNISVELFRSSVPVITVHQTALLGWGRIVKRLFDLVMGTAFLIVASPLMLLLAIGVKLSDPSGPVFMRGPQQNRLTRFDQLFKVYKFRSHYAKFDGKTDEEVFAMVGKPELIEEYRRNGDKLPNDFRVHPFGKFIRRTSLDELPQLINVVRGDISLVGPRALVPQELTAYAKRHAILSVKSGLTGLAVVSGRRNISFDERRKLDLYYVQNWSFWLDLMILLKTIRVVLNFKDNK